ncbi:hypothetical protein CNYM01_02696 [Colletotrichum nymphaeae SA-01]|uniref:Uncharacterized protein n=1 Tax=Colletotrichum nymphaeae SA-01 TaxID=1460502 RepID=A0A135RPQ8_9PEZI|nr:hypothetical protein CNYM01_02696 [Colletotrichum nymphaeae SA-01]
MANLHSRIQEASKEELVQILKAVCSFTDTHYHVESVLDYLDDKKQSEAAAAAKRRLSTRASLSNKSWAQPLPKTVKRNIKMCELCELPFVEKENTNESCLYHYGKWLLECENEHKVWFADLDKAGEEFTSNKDAMCIIDCCNSQRGASKGCVKRKHVALVPDVDTSEDSSDN